MSLGFNKNKFPYFAVADELGFIKVYDENLKVITRCTSGTMQRQVANCVTVADDGTIVAGFGDGFVRCFEV